MHVTPYYIRCRRCPLRAGPRPHVCSVDGESCLGHASRVHCPNGFYEEVTRELAARQALPILPDRPPIPLAGDVVEAIAKRIGADRLAKWWERLTRKPCGCAQRKKRLNAATRRLLAWWGRRSHE
jgi:hypothetical protein